VGRSSATPHVKLVDESYSLPRLEWYKLFCGDEFTGEVLATFQLLEVCVLNSFSFCLGCFFCIFLSCYGLDDRGSRV
jgi:hypothetical protein